MVAHHPQEGHHLRDGQPEVEFDSSLDQRVPFITLALIFLYILSISGDDITRVTQVPGHFWRKIWTFFRYKRCKYTFLKSCLTLLDYRYLWCGTLVVYLCLVL